jgi:hypothetical protein
MSYVSLAAIALSAILIVILGLGDPKRRRSMGNVAGGHGTVVRRLLAFAACLPGLYLAVIGDAAAFLIWFGGCSVVGWLLTLFFGAAFGIRSRLPPVAPES